MARANNLSNFLTDVASAIKTKKGSQTAIPAANFDTEILALPSQGVYQTKVITINENGQTVITPDSGYDAMDGVQVTTLVPEKQLQTKTYNFTQNTNIQLLPDTGYDGFNQVNLEINVPSGGTDTMNLFIQTTEPSTYEGIWIDSNTFTYDNMVEIENISEVTASSINILSGASYSTILYDIPGQLHYSFDRIYLTDSNNDIIYDVDVYYGNGSDWINITPIPDIRLSYIQSNGAQYIDTLIPANSVGTYEITFMLPEYLAWQRIYGTRSNRDGFELCVTLQAGRFRTHINNSHGTEFFIPEVKTDFITLFITSTGLVTYNGTVIANQNRQCTVTETIKLFMGWEINNSKQRIKNFRYYDENNQINLDLIPIRRITDDVVCMYDKISGTYFTNQGTGSFVAGPEIN